MLRFLSGFASLSPVARADNCPLSKSWGRTRELKSRKEKFRSPWPAVMIAILQPLVSSAFGVLGILLGVGVTGENEHIKILALMEFTFQMGEIDDKRVDCQMIRNIREKN